MSLEQRFWLKVVNAPNGCWNWIGNNGGGFRFLEYAYELHHGWIPDGFSVFHHCENPICVNPKHLFAGAIRDGKIDTTIRGRRVNKRNQWVTKYQISEIRAKYRTGKYTMKRLSRAYKLPVPTICKIIHQSIN